jgi:ribosomal protein S3
MLAEYLKYNVVKIKTKKTNNRGILIGYKIKLSGRFSRKQRSSSIWFSFGSVPLNTIKSNIEYNAHSIPIKNSLITIKVWFNIGKNFQKYYFCLI